MKKSLLCGLMLLCLVPLVGCSDLAEKRAELARSQSELQSLTSEIEQMRSRLPAVTKLEEDNKALQKQVYELGLEVDALRKRLAEREAREKKVHAQAVASPSPGRDEQSRTVSGTAAAGSSATPR